MHNHQQPFHRTVSSEDIIHIFTIQPRPSDMTAQRPATAFVRRSEVEQQPRPRLKAPVKLRDFEIDHRYFTEERGGTAQKAPAKPLWLMQGGEEQWGLLRSASHDQFQRPPDHCIRRRDAYTPVMTRVFHDAVEPLPLTSHKAHFTSMGVPRRRSACTPTANRGLFSEIAEQGLGLGLTRTTSMDAFSAKIKPVRRQPFIPPSNKAPFSSVDAPGNAIYRTSSNDHFMQRIVPRRRESFKPDEVGRPPIYANAKPEARLYRTTSQDAFLEKPYVKRKPYAPPRDAGCPY